MTQRASYHTTLKELVHFDLLPVKYTGKIPRTNIHRWKKEAVDRYIGSEINAIADNHTELIRTLNQYPRMFYAYGRLVKTLHQIVATGQEYQNLLRRSKEKIVEAVLKTKDIVSLSSAVQIFNISTSTFHSWVTDVRLQCGKSYFGLCNKVYPNQITVFEVETIKKVLRHPKTQHWSIRSVFYHGIRNGELSVSLNTFYKVNRLLGIRKTKDRFKKKKRKKGIRAKQPNEIWHADITTLKTSDNKRYYLFAY